ncbi:hypothetical protein GWI33_003075 [Rhynchophorus ferrugineus]|nr:hypothetical protein GWI33_003075 [Rhynchophorus ferrugineus]
METAILESRKSAYDLCNACPPPVGEAEAVTPRRSCRSRYELAERRTVKDVMESLICELIVSTRNIAMVRSEIGTIS